MIENKKTNETELRGLTAAEVEKLRAEGKVNRAQTRSGKSYFRIVTDNLFTFFNFVWALVSVVLILIGSWQNMTFLFVIIPNIVIAIVSEVQAKRTVNRLSVTTDPKATVIRDGVKTEIPAGEIVPGDAVVVEMGRQIPADGVVISGFAEANESLLTGEADAIKKEAGARVLAGSFLVSGAIVMRVTAVGEENYIYKIEKSAHDFKKPTSDLFRQMDKLIKGIAVFMVPMTAILFLTNRKVYPGAPVLFGASHDTIVKTCGSVIGMIPAGVYLLITVTLTLSVIKLAKRRTLVQDRYSIEMLARADVLCLDKTGTITDGTMSVTAVESLDGTDLAEIGEAFAYLEGAEESINKTAEAVIRRFGRKQDRKITDRVPFSSARKYAAAAVEGIGIYAFGAPHFVPCKISEDLEAKIAAHAKEGERVLILARLDALDQPGEAVALVAIADNIRPNAAETLAKFAAQDVTVKIISGDHAATVSTIAARVGVANADKFLSCEGVPDDELIAAAEKYTVFGRVTPEQKVLLVKALKANGHVVAMTGDGVNDTLALKEANCAVAMADGSEVARKVSEIVLLDSDFSALPAVVREGRKCINNVAQSTTLFLMKTVFTIVLSFFAAISGTGYPFESRHFFVLETFIIGVAAFLLAIEPNDRRIEGSFLSTVMKKSLPRALAMLVPVLTALLLGTAKNIDREIVISVATQALTLNGLINLAFLCRPYTKWRVKVMAMTTGFVLLMIAGDLWFFEPMLGFVDWFGLRPAAQMPMFWLPLVIGGAALAGIIGLLPEAFSKKFQMLIYSQKT